MELVWRVCLNQRQCEIGEEAEFRFKIWCVAFPGRSSRGDDEWRR
jgi:hypothetical protein